MKLEKLILGTFAAFVETGTTYGAAPVNTVSRELYPSPATHAASWSGLGDVLDAAPEKKEEDYSDTVPSPYGGYTTESDTVVLQDTLKLSLKCHNEIIHRLIWGLASKIEDGVEQTPFANPNRYVEGWINFQLRGQDGADRVVVALYGRIRLDANPKWSKDPSKPAIKFEILRSSIQSILPDGVIA